jgi:hypothetical protein
MQDIFFKFLVDDILLGSEFLLLKGYYMNMSCGDCLHLELEDFEGLCQ